MNEGGAMGGKLCYDGACDLGAVRKRTNGELVHVTVFCVGDET